MTEPDKSVRLSPLAKTGGLLPAKPRAVIVGAVPVAAAVVGAVGSRGPIFADGRGAG